MAALDAFSGQGAQGSQVLRQPNRNQDLGQLGGTGDAHQFESGTRCWMDACGPTHRACSHRHFECADQVAVCILTPAAQAGIGPTAAGIGMRSGFDGAPVIAGGQGNGINAVHDAFIMRGGAVGVHCGKGPSGNDIVTHLFTTKLVKSQVRGANRTARSRQTPVRQIGQDAQQHPSAGNAFNPGGQSLHGGIDRVRPHGIAHIINQVDHQERPDGRRFNDAHLQVARTPAQFFQHRVYFVCLGQ